MKERPILFSAPMVRALLDGSKTQTRRVMKLQPEPPRAIYGSAGADTTITPYLHRCEKGMGVAWRFQMSKISTGKGHHLEAHVIDHEPIRSVCPHGAPGDRLWVRETWAHHVQAQSAARDEDGPFVYAADRPFALQSRLAARWTPAIHMFRWASRIRLEITDVRVEGLQYISEADAIAEGCTNSLHLHGGRFANENFAHLWWTINGDGSWEANPWVWVVEFKRIAP